MKRRMDRDLVLTLVIVPPDQAELVPEDKPTFSERAVNPPVAEIGEVIVDSPLIRVVEDMSFPTAGTQDSQGRRVLSVLIDSANFSLRASAQLNSRTHCDLDGTRHQRGGRGDFGRFQDDW